jgi:H+/Cl- antiporter ClcA
MRGPRASRKRLAGCVIAGLLAGCLSALLTLGVYAAEDSFLKLLIHWKWWPAIGGLAVGLGGMIPELRQALNSAAGGVGGGAIPVAPRDPRVPTFCVVQVRT